MTHQWWAPAALLLTVALPAAAQVPAEAFTTLLGDGDVTTIRSDPDGSIYVLGASDSDELPTKNAFQPDLAPGDCDGRIGREAPCPDLFLAKLTADGELIYLTYLGGSGPERAIDLQVGTDGTTYVLGHTESEDLPETGRVGPPAESYLSSFLAKVSPDGAALLEAVRLPGEPAALTLDGQMPILVGATSDPAFPVVGTTFEPISDSALFVRTSLDGELLVRNAGLSGPVVDVAVAGDRLFALANDIFVSSDGGETWTASGHEPTLGPWPLEGSSLRRIAVAPDDPETVYAAAQGKLLRTRDGALTWTDVTPPRIDDFPHPPEAVAAGLGGRLYTTAYFGRIARSDDFGETWTVIEDSSYVIRILVDPARPARVYAQRSEPHSYGAGLRFSADGGATWEERTFPRNFAGRQMGAAALLLDPSDSSHLYGLFPDQVYESLDGGATWSELGGLGPSARTIDWSPGEPGALYGINRNGVARSADGGRTWEPVDGFVPQDYTDVAVDPRDPATLYVSALGSRLDGFLMGLMPDLRSIAFSTKVGGFGADRPQSVLVEPNGDLIVGGVTDSLDFPSEAAYGGGGTDFFLARFSAADWTRTTATLLGGSGAEAGLRLTSGPDETVYFGGVSDSLDFPALASGSTLPSEDGGAVFGAVGAELDERLFARFVETPRVGCIQSLAMTPEGLDLLGSDILDCGGESPFSEGSAFLAKARPDGSVVTREPLHLGSIAQGFVRLNDGFAVAGGRWLGPSTSLAQPAGVPRSSFGAFVLRFGDGDPSRSEPHVAAVVDAAAYTGGPLAPGLIGSLFGVGLGPAAGAAFELVEDKLPTELASTRVLIDGRPASMLFAQDGQVNFVASFAIEPRTMAEIRVETAEGLSAPWRLPVSGSHVGLFSSEGFGRGDLVALNQDGSLNTEENPAEIGSVVSVFGVGAGTMSPPMEDGSIAPLSLPLPKPDHDIGMTVGERPAEVLYAGAAPGLAAGVIQINFRVPDGIGPHGVLPVELRIGNKRFGRRGGLWLRVSREP